MSDDHNDDQQTHDSSHNERIARLEAQNERLMNHVQELSQKIDTGDERERPRVSRRQALGGLLASGALFGTGRSNTAAATTDDGDPFADEGHDHSTDHLGDGVPVERITTDTLNNVVYAAPGEVQAKIDQVYEAMATGDGEDGVDPNGIVKLYPQQTYNEGAEIWVKPSVTLDFNGALLEVSSDHNGLLVDNEAKAKNVNLVVTDDSYASEAVVVDASRNLGEPKHEWAYGPEGMPAQKGENNGVEIDGALRGKTASGTGLALRPYAGQGVFTNHIDLDIFYFDTGILADTSDGWINGVDIWAYFQSNRVQIDHIGDGPFNSIIYGHMQNGRFTDYEIRNQTTAGSCTFIGQIWDTVGVNKSALAGPHINVITDGHMAGELARNSPEAGQGTTTTSWWDNRQVVGVPATGDVWRWVYVDGNVELQNNGVTVWSAIGDQSGDHPAALSVPSQSLTVDGDLSDLSEASTVSLSLSDDFSVYRGTYTNGGTVWWTWDQEYLYLAIDLDDDDHVQDEPADKMWRDDCIQFGVSAGMPGEADTWDGGTIGLTSDGSVVHHVVHPETPNPGVLDSAAAAIVRENGHTRYEIGLPWNELTASPSDGYVSLALAIHDADSDGTTGWLEWGDGILGGKNNTGFKPAELVADSG